MVVPQQNCIENICHRYYNKLVDNLIPAFLFFTKGNGVYSLLEILFQIT